MYSFLSRTPRLFLFWEIHAVIKTRLITTSPTTTPTTTTTLLVFIPPELEDVELLETLVPVVVLAVGTEGDAGKVLELPAVEEPFDVKGGGGATDEETGGEGDESPDPGVVLLAGAGEGLEADVGGDGGDRDFFDLGGGGGLDDGGVGTLAGGGGEGETSLAGGGGGGDSDGGGEVAAGGDGGGDEEADDDGEGGGDAGGGEEAGGGVAGGDSSGGDATGGGELEEEFDGGDGVVAVDGDCAAAGGEEDLDDIS